MSKKEFDPQSSLEDTSNLPEELLRLYTLGAGHRMRMTSQGLQIDEGSVSVEDVLGKRGVTPAEAQRLLEEARRRPHQG